MPVFKTLVKDTQINECYMIKVSEETKVKAIEALKRNGYIVINPNNIKEERKMGSCLFYVPFEDYILTKEALYQVGFSKYNIKEIQNGLYIEYQMEDPNISTDNFSVEIKENKYKFTITGMGSRKYRESIIDIYQWYKKAKFDKRYWRMFHDPLKSMNWLYE